MGFLQLPIISKVKHTENTQILKFNFYSDIFPGTKKMMDFRKTCICFSIKN